MIQIPFYANTFPALLFKVGKSKDAGIEVVDHFPSSYDDLPSQAIEL